MSSLTLKKLLSKFYEIPCISNEVIQVLKNFNQIFKNFNQKKTKFSLWPKYGKIENYFSKILLWTSSLTLKKFLCNLYEIPCISNEVIQVSKKL